jgi:hypothetical protein
MSEERVKTDQEATSDDAPLSVEELDQVAGGMEEKQKITSVE